MAGRCLARSRAARRGLRARYAMTFLQAVINCPLEADVLTASEKIEDAEWCSGVRRVDYEGSDHGTGSALVDEAQSEGNSADQNKADGPGRIQIEPAPRYEFKAKMAVD